MTEPPLQIPADQLERALANAARLGAKAALREVGLHDENAVHDIRDLRSLLDAWRSAKSTVWQTISRSVALAVIGAVGASVWLSWPGPGTPLGPPK